MKTDYNAKYFANDLTKKCSSDTIEKFVGTLSDARVQLNPHQIDAALFAFKSPFSKGAILADEVGLGKTIEAGIVISQYWAERKRKLLIIMPAALRKQWQQELQEKFFLPSIILEAKSFNAEINKGNFNPFEQDQIIICSYQFARSKDIYIKKINWDLVVIDEAHRLRNVYKPTNKIANAIKNAIYDKNKILLTATPLQNSLMELYGLTSIIDEYTFGDLTSFKAQYCRNIEHIDFDDLKKRLSAICQRTLRKQVLEYIKYTNRIALTEEFYPTDAEHELYEKLTEYLQRERLYALPKSQRILMDLILRRLLASSTYAVAGTLGGLAQKLQGYIDNNENAKNEYIAELQDNIENYDELSDEFVDEEEIDEEDELKDKTKHFSPTEIEEIKEEQRFLQNLYELAKRTDKNAKGEKLLIALNKGFEENAKNGGSKKALIFTESTRTQNYIKDILETTEYAGKLVLFNGSNNDAKSKEIYNNWLIKNKDTDKISGSKTADKRAALVDYFKDEAEIMIATEAAAEGINLQFCSLIVNYDLPWNPQRIEQRIGRCHRYGQKNDVVVVNFLNKKNAADIRVYELLKEKFKLFDGVFGASDEVLGATVSGIDFERRVADILRSRRSEKEIELEFDELQKQLETEIGAKLSDTRKKLLENFDVEVAQKLKISQDNTFKLLDRFEQELWDLTEYELRNYATFDDDIMTFAINRQPYSDINIPLGKYKLSKDTENAYSYRIGHPLAKKIIENTKDKTLPIKELSFDYSHSKKNIATLKNYVGQSGWMTVQKLSVKSFETEEAIMLAGYTDSGEIIDEENCKKMFLLDAKEESINDEPSEESISFILANLKDSTIKSIKKRNAKFFDDQIDKIEKWAKDRKNSLSVTLKDIEEEIEEKKKLSREAVEPEEKFKYYNEVRDLEKKQGKLQMEFYNSRTKIDDEKDTLISQMTESIHQEITETELFTIRWNLL